MNTLSTLFLLATCVLVFALWRKGDVRAGITFAGGMLFLEAKDRQQKQEPKERRTTSSEVEPS